ncbi:MAG: hypothetical protein KKH60_06715 [Proteobacteria bacterium]|nr:hypothetical protein [Pseudomonadota bacterium]
MIGTRNTRLCCALLSCSAKAIIKRDSKGCTNSLIYYDINEINTLMEKQSVVLSEESWCWFICTTNDWCL